MPIPNRCQNTFRKTSNIVTNKKFDPVANHLFLHAQLSVSAHFTCSNLVSVTMSRASVSSVAHGRSAIARVTPFLDLTTRSPNPQ
jgi:predicted nucleic acid binding AN1-type Zn finger protein